ncbi:MAG: glycosyltransferase family 4 protein [Ruminiclostridium sp.]|nr:glycosyltransferase family 4 protein [Ruminiclostridium sp.]
MNKKILAAAAILAAACAGAYFIYSRRTKKSDKITVNMKSQATSVPGQGVGSAYLEQVRLIKEDLGDKYEVTENAHIMADITHYHTINPTYFLLRPIACARGRSVGYVHMLPETVETSLNLPKIAKKLFYWYMIRFYDSMDYLVTVNPYFIGRLEHYGIPRERVTYIPNYVSSDKFHPLPYDKKMELRDKYGIPRDAFVAVCAGQLQVRKGFFDFLEIAKRRPDMVFAWAGDFSFGAITDGYKEIQKVKEDPPANLKLLGMIPRDDMNEIYNIGDVMFLPSFEELFPMTILEAMCANVPILLRDLEIYNDILFDFYYRETSVDGFINELVKLRDDPDHYNAGVEASKRGNKFYSKEHVVKMWDDFYTMVYDSMK